MPFHEVLWVSLMRLLDPGTMGQDLGWGFRVAMLAITSLGLILVSTFTGLMTNVIALRIETLRKGKTKVVENGHTVILGWAPQIFPIIQELIIANECENDGCIVVLASEDKLKMEEEIRKKINNTKNTRVICRTGYPADCDDLNLAGAASAASFIVLSSPFSDSGNIHLKQGSDVDNVLSWHFSNSDAYLLKTVLAIKKIWNEQVITCDTNVKSLPTIVAEIHSPENIVVAKNIGNYDNKECLALVSYSEVLSRIIAQTCRTPGLSLVYSDLLNFEGQEIYQHKLPQLVGMKYFELLFAVDDATVIGIQQGNRLRINPPMDTVYRREDEIIVIAKDRKTVKVSNDRFPIDENAIRYSELAIATPENTLILGWNRIVPRVIFELEQYVAPQSIIKVVSKCRIEEYEEWTKKKTQIKNQEVEFVNEDPARSESLNKIDFINLKFKRAIIFGDATNRSPEESDAHAIMTLLKLRKLVANLPREDDYEMSIVTEIQDYRNKSLFEEAKIDDFIASNHIISMLLSQVSRNKNLNEIFSEQFSSKGTVIDFILATNYLNSSTPVTFATVIEACRKKNQTAFGFRKKNEANDRDKNFGIYINPPRNTLIHFAQWDRIILFRNTSTEYIPQGDETYEY